MGNAVEKIAGIRKYFRIFGLGIRGAILGIINGGW